jgi:hypothetical protein
MNKIYLSVLLIFFQLCSLAQSDTVLLRTCYLQGTADFSERTFLVFDSLNSTNGEYVEVWDDSLGWQPDSRSIYSLNAVADTFLERHYIRWFNNWRWSYSYYYLFDNLDRPIVKYSMNYYSTPNDTSERFHYTYGSSGELIADTNYTYHQTGFPVPDTRNEYYYTPSNQLDSVVTFLYDTAGWSLYSYRKYFRDTNQNDTLRLLMLYNNTTGMYDSSEMVVVERDYVNLADSTSVIWFIGTSWSTEFSSYRNYDLQNRIIYSYSTCSACGFTSYENIYTGTSDSLSEQIYCHFTHGGLGQCDSCIYYYQPYITKINEAEELNINIYPDPADNILNIDLKNSENILSLEIYDLTGRLVQQIINKKENRFIIDTAFLPVGTYMIRVVGESRYIVRSVRIIH